MAGASPSTQRGEAADLLTVPMKTRCNKAPVHTPRKALLQSLRSKNRMNYLPSSPHSSFLSFPFFRFSYLQREGNPSQFLGCATKKIFPEDTVEGGRDSKGEDTEAANIEETP